MGFPYGDGLYGKGLYSRRPDWWRGKDCEQSGWSSSICDKIVWGPPTAKIIPWKPAVKAPQAGFKPPGVP